MLFGAAAPILLGAGIRLYDGKRPIRLHRLDPDDPTAVLNVRFRPVTADPPAATAP